MNSAEHHVQDNYGSDRGGERPNKATAKENLPNTSKRNLLQVIMSPGIDRVIAIIAIIPFIYVTYQNIMHIKFAGGDFNVPHIAAIIASLVMIASMVLRRAPSRVTLNPWFWLLAFAATYGTLWPALFSQRGVHLVSITVSNAVALLAMAIFVYARISLGRNIGYVPAQRQLVTNGAYAYVRHPIYTGLFVTYAGLLLRSYSPLNLIMIMIIVALFIIKSFAEESFLVCDPHYAKYMQEVRYRWLPGII